MSAGAARKDGRRPKSNALDGSFQKFDGDLIARLLIEVLMKFSRLNQAKLVFQIIKRILLFDQNLNPASLLLQLCTTKIAWNVPVLAQNGFYFIDIECHGLLRSFAKGEGHVRKHSLCLLLLTKTFSSIVSYILTNLDSALIEYESDGV